MHIELKRSGPPPLFLVHLPAEWNIHRPEIDLWQLAEAAAMLTPGLLAESDFFGCQYRAVGIDRISVVMKSGIDVEPPDSVFYANAFDKALEYGGWPKVVMAIRNQSLDRTFRELPADTAAERIAELRNVFPTELRSADGTHLWLSRLAVDDPRLTTPYEFEYAWWIPGSTREALAAVFVLIHPDVGSGHEVLLGLLNESE
jgi:hypothetical protein